MFRHPKYYKELRSIRNKLDQAISERVTETSNSKRSPGPGLQQVIEETVPHNDIEEASSNKLQASSSKLVKPQATSFKPRG